MEHVNLRNGGTEALITPEYLYAVATGLGPGVGTMADLQKVVEFFCGHPVWTHELADPKIWDKARDNLIAADGFFQHIADATPQGISLDIETATSLMEEIREHCPNGCVFQKPEGRRTEHPMDSLARIAKGKRILGILIPDKDDDDA